MAHIGSVVRSDPTLSAVYIAGATSHYNEMILPSAPDPGSPGPLTANEPVGRLSSSCQEYIDAWERATDTMNSQFNVKVITPLDAVPDCSNRLDAYNALRTYTAPGSPLSMRALGTVNVGYFQTESSPYTDYQDPTWWDQGCSTGSCVRPQFHDRKGSQTQTEYWEMGPRKMDPDNPSDATMAKRVQTVTDYLGSGNNPYFYADAVTMLIGNWNDGALTRQQVCLAVQGYAPWYPATGNPNCTSYNYGLK
jgi:hypothetical protein